MKIAKSCFVLFAILYIAFPGLLSAAPQGKLVIAQGTELTSLDPAKHVNYLDMNYDNAVFDKLYIFDADGNVIPSLAISHRIINPTTWELKLKENVKFHNNDNFTAADVKYSIEHVQDPKTRAPYASFFSLLKEITVIDDYTVRIVTDKPDPILLKRLAHNIYILPSKYIMEKGYETFQRQPIGTGPFKFIEWIRNDRLVLEANEQHWAGAPLIKTVIFRAIPEDSTRVAELQTGMVDIITNVPPILVGQLKTHPGVEVKSIPSGRVLFMYLNTFSEGPLKDKRVRQALNYAVDKKAIIDKVLLGSGFPIGIHLIPSDFGYDSSIKPYPYDPEKAKQLLAQAGHKDLKLVLNSPTGRYVMDKQVTEAVAGMFQGVGVKVDYRVKEWGDYMNTLLGRKMEDVALIGFGQVMYDADGRFYLSLVKDSTLCYYADPEVEGWVLEARHSMDPDRRKEIYSMIQKKIYEEAALLWLYQQQDNWGVSKRVKGFQPTSYEIFYLHKVSLGN